jgi:alpha-beta hydrolase superfamily lysophospholipase
MVHGLGAHSGWFEALARRLKVKQIFCLAYDQIGFGKRRAHELTSYQQWLDDLPVVSAYLKEQVGDKPIFLMGNSMGGVVSLCGAPAVSPEGLVLFSPGFAGNSKTFSLGYKLRGLIQAFLSPDTEIQLPYGSDAFIREQSVRSWVDSDQEARMSVAAKTLLELLKLTNQVEQQTQLVSCPTLIATAGMDKIIDNKAVNAVFEKLSVPKKRRHFVEAYHDLMFDPLIDDLTNELVDWIAGNVRTVSVEV